MLTPQTSRETWDANHDPISAGKYLPCMNPSCKSHGKPHPNCRCWGQKEAFFAGGGEVESYCGSDRAHNSDCEYFAEGGEALPSFEATQPLGNAEAVALPSFEETTEIALPEFEATEELPEEKYGSLGQQALAGVEGLAKGVAGPLATFAQTEILGMDPEGIKGRAAANPATSAIAEGVGLVGGLFTGVGEAALLAKVAAKVAPIAEGASILSRVGMKAAQGAIEAGLYQGGDEASKALLGEGDPTAPVAAALTNVGTAALFGGVAGGVFGSIADKAAGSAKAALESINDEKLEKSFRSMLVGYGAGAFKTAEELPHGLLDEMSAALDPKMFKLGTQMFDFAQDKGKQKVVGETARVMGAHFGPVGYVAANAAAPYIEKAMGGPLTNLQKQYVVPVVMKALASGDTQGIGQAIRYGKMVAKGAADIADNVDSLFSVGAQKAFNYGQSEQERAKTKEYLEQNGLGQQMQNSATGEGIQAQGFARGGSVDPLPVEKVNGIARLYPDQNAMIATAKGRVVGHLNSLRPTDGMKLPFDKKPSRKDADKRYDRAIDIANKPLSVFEYMRKGTLRPDDVKDLATMYPELKGSLDRALTERIMKAQLNGEKPTYKKRQMMSLFLGAPLSSEMLPQSIQAAQGVFRNQDAAKAQIGQAQKNKKGTAPLSKADDNAWTSDQAAQKRQSAER